MSSPRMQIGDLAPFTCGITGRKAFWSFDAQAGRALALVVIGRLEPMATTPFFTAFARDATAFAATGADVIGLVDADSPHARAYIESPPPGVELVFCMPEVFQNWRFETVSPVVFALDRALHLIGWTQSRDPSLAVESVLTDLRAEPRDRPRDEPLPAPVLMAPHILEKSFCRELIAHFESSQHTPGGMASVDASGQPFHKIDESKKKRRDLLLGPDDPFNPRVLAAISRVCAPELKKAFCFDATHIDRILVARYDDGGKFLRHRDNADGSVAFRHFALSINLNDDYEGGHLIFPEYNDHRYRPTAGGGIIFSASLLHEACLVTKGSRYVVLTFLHGAAHVG
jgi:hypothetical protein